jgi:hypothetical protein
MGINAQGALCKRVVLISRFPDGNDRQKCKGKSGMAFVVTNPSRVREEWGDWFRGWDRKCCGLGGTPAAATEAVSGGHSVGLSSLFS